MVADFELDCDVLGDNPFLFAIVPTIPFTAAMLLNYYFFVEVDENLFGWNDVAVGGRSS